MQMRSPCFQTMAGVLILLFLTLLSLPARAMTVTDARGQQVTVATPVRRIVAQNSDALEALRILKAQDRIVGVYAEILREPAFWAECTELPKTGGWRTPNLEAIANLDPDLVLVYSRHPGEEFEQKLGALGIAVLRLDLYKPATLEKEIRELGRVLGKENEAQAFLDWHSSHLTLIHDRIATASHHPKVYVESYFELSTVGPGSGGHDICLLAGGRNIAGDMELPYPKVTSEWVVTQNPDVIVKAASYGNGYQADNAEKFNALRNSIMARPVWSSISAVQTGRVHVMDSAIWAGPRSIIGVAWLARWFYPKQFDDIKPERWHAEYLERFQGIAHQGVYVSDPVSGESP